MEHGSGANWLTYTLIYLGAAVAAVPLARWAGLGAIIGYLAAGIVIGPAVLGLVQDPQAVLHFADFGVVLMLFLVGLELEPRRLWSMRGPIFGWGSVQLFGSTALLMVVAAMAGVPWRLALVASLALAMSSTAIGLAVLAERNLMATGAGQRILGVALLQDIAAIPILAVIPLLAIGGGSSDAAGTSGWWQAAKAVGVIVAIVFGGRLLLRPALRWIARSETPEIFTAAALLLVVATAALMQAVGLSMALGAFLAGVLLAESEYRTELETDLEPFKGLLLGLFFIAVGMGIDFRVVAAHPWLVAGIVAGFLLVKMVVLGAMARAIPVAYAERPVFIVLLAQGGEFGFVVLQQALGAGAVDATTASTLIAAIALSMMLTPLLLIALDRLWARHAARHGATGPALAEIDEQQDAPVVVCGFGRYGQIVGRLLSANGLRATVLDHDAAQVQTVRKFGWQAYYGDATRLDLLRTAGAGEARVIVVAVDGVEQSLQIVDLARRHFPQAQIVARARNVDHWEALVDRGVHRVERETFESALRSGRSVLELMGWDPNAARMQAMRFRQHTFEMFESLRTVGNDQQQVIAVAKRGRQQLEQMWAGERAELQARRQRQDSQWAGAPGAAGATDAPDGARDAVDAVGP